VGKVDRLGVGYLGTDSIKTSVANEELVPVKPEHWTRGYSFYKFSFVNKQACKVIINGESTIFLDAEQGFEMGEVDALVKSFVIVEPDIEYQFIACY
jgi:hypothetical protein